MISDEQRAALKRLARPFPKSAIRQRPVITCPACELLDRDQAGETCPQHQAEWCEVCSETFTRAHEHLDYVGHAHVRERLNEVDPGWDFEPLGHNDDGTPAFDTYGGLWIKLTVVGVSRTGYGDAEGRRGPAAIKEVIGDALRNAGLSFGMALDLWKRQTPGRRRRTRSVTRSAAALNIQVRNAETVRTEIRAHTARRWGWQLPRLDADFTNWVGGPGGQTFMTAPPGVLERYLTHLKSIQDVSPRTEEAARA